MTKDAKLVARSTAGSSVKQLSHRLNFVDKEYNRQDGKSFAEKGAVLRVRLLFRVAIPSSPPPPSSLRCEMNSQIVDVRVRARDSG